VRIPDATDPKYKDDKDGIALQVSLLEQIKWTLFILTDKESQRKLSPVMSLEIVNNLGLIMRAFNPMPYSFVG
jgi:hypothetical protein